MQIYITVCEKNNNFFFSSEEMKYEYIQENEENI